MTATKTTTQPRRPMPRQGFRVRLEQAREDIARLTAAKTNEVQTLYALMQITDDLWEATQPDEAPEFETTVRMVRAS